MRHSPIWLVCLSLQGCGEDCPGYPVEVRSYVGPDIVGTAVTCEGDELEFWSPCVNPDFSGLITAPNEECSAARLSLGGPSLAGRNLTIYMKGSTVLDGANVVVADSCDNEPCPPAELVPVLSGYIAAQEFSAAGRNRGEFELAFEEGTISGTYDTGPP